MKIFINDLISSPKEHFSYDYYYPNNSCVLCARKVIFKSVPKLSCQVLKQENNILYANINVHLDTVLSCVRCLDDMNAKQDVQISGILRNSDIDDSCDAIIVDDFIDLEKIFFDAVFEHLNSNNFCDENCKGLCQICGQNLNHNFCNCKKEYTNIDPRLANLKDFFKS